MRGAKQTPKMTEGAYAQSVMNAAALRGIMDDPRWETVVLVIKQLLAAAQSKTEAARNDPSFDAMIKSTHFDGQVRMAKILLHTLTQMYDRAGEVLKDARSKLPYAPQPQEQRRQRDPNASRDTHKEDTDAGRKEEG